MPKEYTLLAVKNNVSIDSANYLHHVRDPNVRFLELKAIEMQIKWN
jgi:hypothetical protein